MAVYWTVIFQFSWQSAFKTSLWSFIQHHIYNGQEYISDFISGTGLSWLFNSYQTNNYTILIPRVGATQGDSKAAHKINFWVFSFSIWKYLWLTHTKQNIYKQVRGSYIDALSQCMLKWYAIITFISKYTKQM